MRLLLAFVLVLGAGDSAGSYSLSHSFTFTANPPCYVLLSPDAYHEAERHGYSAADYAQIDIAGKLYQCQQSPDPRLEFLESLRDTVHSLVTPFVRWGMTLLAVSGAVVVSLAWRRELWGLIFSAVMMAAAILMAGAIDNYFWFEAIRNIPAGHNFVKVVATEGPPQDFQNWLPWVLFAATTPYLLALCSIWLTSRLARKPA
jgi:hypothetical protein